MKILQYALPPFQILNFILFFTRRYLRGQAADW